MNRIVKDQLSFARADREIIRKFKATCSSMKRKPGIEIERFMVQVILTNGLNILDLEADELLRKGQEQKQYVKTMRLNMQESYTDAMISDVLKALSRKTKDGANREVTYDSIEFAIKKISEDHKIPSISVLTCMRRYIYELYQDNNGETDRILKILDRLNDVDIKVIA